MASPKLCGTDPPNAGDRHAASRVATHAEPRLYVGPAPRERPFHNQYTGTPTSTPAIPSADLPGCVAIVFMTITPAASTNASGVQGYPGTRNGLTTPDRFLSTKTQMAPIP